MNLGNRRACTKFVICARMGGLYYKEYLMSRYTGPKNRIARRFGVNIFGRLRNPLLHKPNPPGMHGAKRRKKSDYGMQLEEKQKLKNELRNYRVYITYDMYYNTPRFWLSGSTEDNNPLTQE